MTVNFKSGSNKNHFACLQPGDTFIVAEDMGIPSEKRSVYMKVSAPDYRENCAVRLGDGMLFVIAPRLSVIKVESELSVVL